MKSDKKPPVVGLSALRRHSVVFWGVPPSDSIRPPQALFSHDPVAVVLAYIPSQRVRCCMRAAACEAYFMIQDGRPIKAIRGLR